MPIGDDNTPPNTSWNSSSFPAFFEGWLVRQEHYLDELLSAQDSFADEDGESQQEEVRGLISRVLSHYQQYYQAKALAARNDVFHVFSPSWFSTLERSFLWIGGFKPGLVFRLLGSAVGGDMGSEQLMLIERLKGETRAAEKELEEEMASVQESVAAPPLVEMARRAGRLVDRERRSGADNVLESLRRSAQVLVESADHLRAMTTSKVIEVLSPAQGVRLLAAAAQLQLRIRMWGAQRDGRPPRTP
ncbi:hypothetical protein Scep_015537 [Stephania cephalantha]|uniref:DOG1 domain-containing protein n=1 Tax=Stephania cephalantha TaxID=152367 RepID=A0AAP0J5T7_9MAGN